MKKIGRTRKVSLTLPEELWEHLDSEYSDMSLSNAIRDMLEYQYIIQKVRAGEEKTPLINDDPNSWAQYLRKQGK